MNTTLVATAVPFASQQGGLVALFFIGGFMAWAVVGPVLLVSSLCCLAYNLLRRGVGWLALVFEVLVVGSNVLFALFAVPLSVSVLGAPGANMIIGFVLGALLALALSAGIVVSAAISRSSVKKNTERLAS